MVTLRKDIEEEISKITGRDVETVKEVLDLTIKNLKEEVILKKENIMYVRFKGLGTIVNSFDLNKQAIIMTSSHRKDSLRKRIDYMCEYRDLSRVFAVPLVYAVAFFQLGLTGFSKLYKNYYDTIEKLSYNQNKRMSKYFESDT